MNIISRRIIFFVCTLSLTMLVSCGDDELDTVSNESSIMGVWVSAPLSYYEDNVLMPSYDCVMYGWFKENGTYVEADVITNHQNGHSWIELSENGKWSVKDDYVTITANFENDDPEHFYTDTYRFKVNHNTLFLYSTYEDKEVTGQLERTTTERIQEIISAKKNK